MDIQDTGTRQVSLIGGTNTQLDTGSPSYGDISANTYQACQMKVGAGDGGFGIYNYVPNEVFNFGSGGFLQTRLSFYLKNKSPTNPTDLTGLLGGAE